MGLQISKVWGLELKRMLGRQGGINWFVGSL